MLSHRPAIAFTLFTSLARRRGFIYLVAESAQIARLIYCTHTSTDTALPSKLFGHHSDAISNGYAIQDCYCNIISHKRCPRAKYCTRKVIKYAHLGCSFQLPSLRGLFRYVYHSLQYISMRTVSCFIILSLCQGSY